jgi:hypothetical protein
MTDNVKPSLDDSRSRIQTPAILDTLRSRGVQRLGELLKSMFDRLDNIVFEWARSLPDTEQQSYMDVIVVVRAKRSEMESRFIAGMATVFMQLLQGGTEKKASVQGGLGAVDFSSLSLVNTDEMDISVMVDSMVARARMEYAAPLGLLRRRFGQVLPKVEVLDRNMPLDPGPITANFKDALSLLDVGVPEKLLVLRVFQQQLLAELGALLDEANQLFIDAGVLPELKVAFAGGAAKKAAAKAESAAKQHVASTEEIFSFLQGLLGQGVMGPVCLPAQLFPQ